MVIRLTTGTQIGGALRYNEQKVVQKQALVLGATGFANNELAAKNRSYISSVLESQSKKNSHVKKPTIHFSLSLHPSEQVSDEKFQAMAHQFMAEMGYQRQPYIIYRHHDTAHPHIHIVTTCVDAEGAKINDAFSKRRTNTARQKLELRFGLIKAQGRGKAVEQIKTSGPLQRVDNLATAGQAVGSETEKKAHLENILRQTFQQTTFTSMDEFRHLLKKQQVHTTLHQSTTNGKPMRGISYQFTDTDGKPTTPRIKASEIGPWATWNGVEKQFGRTGPDLVVERSGQAQPQRVGQKQPDALSNEQYKVLAALLSGALRDYKKKERIYFESTLLENFPTVAMQTALGKLAGEKLTQGEISEAVRRFEDYKRSQLPEIIKKEQLSYIRTMDTYTKIGSEIEGSGLNKLQFLSALNVKMDKTGLITSPDNRHLAYQIGDERWSQIRQDTGPELKIPSEYSRGERVVLLLSDSGKAFNQSYYDVRVEQLEKILRPDTMQRVHQQLNANYVARLNKDAPVVGVEQLRYFYQRGIVVDAIAPPPDSTGRGAVSMIRYNQAPPGAAVKPDNIFAKQFPYVNSENWQRGLSTESGRYMVALAQCIDLDKAERAAGHSGKAGEITYLRNEIHRRDNALETVSDTELLGILEKRSQQGNGWVRQTERDASQEQAYLNAKGAGLLDMRAVDVFGYEQTGKYKNVGKGIKKHGKGREL